MKYPTLEELRELSEDEHLNLLEDLWETFASTPGSLPLGADHAQEIDRRLKAWQKDPNVGSTWAEVRRRIEKK